MTPRPSVRLICHVQAGFLRAPKGFGDTGDIVQPERAVQVSIQSCSTSLASTHRCLSWGPVLSSPWMSDTPGPHATVPIHPTHPPAPVVNKPWGFAQRKSLEKHRCGTGVLDATQRYEIKNQSEVCSAFSILSVVLISCCYAIPQASTKGTASSAAKMRLFKEPLCLLIFIVIGSVRSV